jgi:hypothetical protein
MVKVYEYAYGHALSLNTVRTECSDVAGESRRGDEMTCSRVDGREHPSLIAICLASCKIDSISAFGATRPDL